MSGLRSAVETLVQKWRSHRHSMQAARELASLDPAIAAGIAAEAGVSVRELQDVIVNGAGADRLMQRMMSAFGIDQEHAADSPAVLRDAAILCSRCGSKRRCRGELDAGTARDNADLFCPNALTFDTMT